MKINYGGLMGNFIVKMVLRLNGLDGQKEWYVNGKLHRTDGPAVIHANGHKEWWVDGKLHRTDGPAMEFANGAKKWWINDNHIDCTTQEQFERLIKLQPFW